MSKSLLHLAGALVALASFGSASAGIDTVNGAATDVHAALGSQLTIAGTGFGTAKPKVFVEFDGKLYALKVTEFDDTHIVADIKKGKLGEHVLHVRPKGVPADEDFLFAESVILDAPVIDSIENEAGDPITEATPGLMIHIVGDFFGAKKFKIFIGGKKAKVIEWTMEQIMVEMPKTLPNGLMDILLSSKIGSDDDETIEMTESDVKVGKKGINVFIDGVKAKLGFGGGAAPGGYGCVAVATSGTNPAKTFLIAVPFTDGGDLPQDYVMGTDLMIASWAIVGFNPVVSNIYLANNGFTVTILQNGGGQVKGEFSGTMDLQGGAETIEVTGDFVVDLIDLP